MLRRTFLQAMTVAPALAQSAAVPALDNAPPIKLGFDTYSLRDFHWSATELIDYAAKLKLDGLQISGMEDYRSLEPAYLKDVREHAESLGLTIDAGIGCICPLSSAWNPKDGDPTEHVVRGLKVAQAVGARSMRCFLGHGGDRRGPRPIEALMQSTIDVFRSVRQQALDAGVKIALENHSGDLQAREVKTIIEESGKDFVGACLDTGNPMWVVEDPLVSLEVLGPYVLTTHVRDSAVYEHPRGAAAQWVPLGDGNVDFPKFISRYKQLCPHATMQLEIITGRPPRVLNYLEPEFWKPLPNANAAEFARFVALAKSGHPFNGFMVVEDGAKDPPNEFTAALREQQRRDLERSLEYAKKSLGAGVRWRT